MIWLASYPRSGNTYFRNILLEVYGLASSDFHLGIKKKLDPNFDKAAIVKTHLLPKQLPERLQKMPAIYLVRDGRDAMVSLAHHRLDIKKTGGTFLSNLFEISLGLGNRFGVNWSEHVEIWSEKADLVIKYEDLIADPIKQTERLRSLINLPEPELSKLPTFKKLKEGSFEYGAGKDMSKNEAVNKQHAQKFYRKGIAGSYKTEMPKAFQLLFWVLHRKQMKKLKYY